MLPFTIPQFVSFSLSDWMCLHNWVVTGKEPFKISHLLVPQHFFIFLSLSWCSSLCPPALFRKHHHVHSAAICTDQLPRNVNNTATCRAVGLCTFNQRMLCFLFKNSPVNRLNSSLGETNLGYQTQIYSYISVEESQLA